MPLHRKILAGCALLLLVGCDYMPFGYTPIGEIQENPAQFQEQEIRIRGVVTDISRIPFLDIKSYLLRDDSGEIAVLTEDALPAMDEAVAIKATVQTAATLGRQSFGVRVKETGKLPTLWAGK